MNNLEKDFVPYQEALELKQLGFDEPCFSYYNKEVNCNLCWKSNSVEPYNHNDATKYDSLSAPTFSQCFRFFRERFDLHYSIDRECSQHDHKWGYNWSIYNYNKVVETEEEYITSHPNAPSGEWVYSSYPDAELACLKKLIEIVKKSFGN